jgi:hypothetical protein
MRAKKITKQTSPVCTKKKGMNICVYIHTRIHVHAYMHIRIMGCTQNKNLTHKHIHIYIYIYMYMHTCMKSTAILIRNESQFQDFQRFSSSKLVLKTVKKTVENVRFPSCLVSAWVWFLSYLKYFFCTLFHTI